MLKPQLIALITSILLFLVLFFGFDTKPKEQAKIEKARAMVSESTNISILLKDAKKKLNPENAANILALETELEQVQTDSAKKIEVLKRISGSWYQLGQPGISGYFAENIAEIMKDEDSWSITGTTYSICLQNSEEEKIKDYCYGRAIKAFENAISINPENMQHQVNLALCFADKPPKDNPMKGVLMLLDLNKRDPENTTVLMTLGRMGMKTGQFEKAIGRFENVLKIEPTNKKALCLLAEAHQAIGNTSESTKYLSLCRE